MRGTKIFLSILMFGAAVTGQAAGRRAGANNLFPAASCNPTLALSTLRERVDSKNLNIEWDGDLPWPDVLGVWTNTSRDAYAAVEATEVPAAKWGRIRVTLRSICTDQILAQGAKIITDNDWSQEYLVVRLRNFALNGSRLSALIRNPKQSQASNDNMQKKLEVKVFQNYLNSDDADEAVLRDSFIADQF